MAKRFISTSMWDDPEFLKLTAECKALWQYLFTKCDIAGVIKWSDRIASFLLHGNEDINANLEQLIQLGWVERICEKKLWLPKFIQFQYGNLNPNCKPHKAVIDLLEKHGLLERVMQGLGKGKERVQDKDKDKDKGKDKEIRGECEGGDGFTQQQVHDAAAMLGIPQDKADEFFNHYDAQGWVFGNGQPIKKLQAAMMRWKNHQYRFTSKSGGKPYPGNSKSLEEKWEAYEKAEKEKQHAET